MHAGSHDFLAAARTDEALKKRVHQAREHYDQALESIWLKFFSDVDLSEREIKAQLKLTMSRFRGMSLKLLIQSDRSALDEMVIEWKNTWHRYWQSRI